MGALVLTAAHDRAHGSIEEALPGTSARDFGQVLWPGTLAGLRPETSAKNFGETRLPSNTCRETSARYCCETLMERSTPPPAAPHLRLGVNIDHVATIRNARGGRHPDPLRAAHLAVEA